MLNTRPLFEQLGPAHDQPPRGLHVYSLRLPTNGTLPDETVLEMRLPLTVQSDVGWGADNGGLSVMQGDQGLNDLQVIVERRGYGARAWAWRLAAGTVSLATSPEGFVCAEDAYAAGRVQLLEMRAGTPPQLSSVGSLMSESMKHKALPTLRRARSRRQPALASGW